MLEALQILSEELPLVGTNISALVVIAVVFAISYKVSSIFESRIFRYLIFILSLITLLNPIEPKNHSVFFNIHNWIALGALIPHIKYIFEDLEEKYYQLKYATINAYYFWLTVYYKLLRIARALIWLAASIFNAVIWFYYTLKHTLILIAYFANSVNKAKEDALKTRFRDYLRWYKEDWQYQSKQREYAKYEYQEWYKGKKFYYKDQDNYFDDSWSQKHKQEDESKRWQEQERAYEEYKKQHGYSKQEESKSYQKSYQNQSEQKQYSSEHARFFSGNYYEVLGVTKDATYKEINIAWKKLLKEYHPDLYPQRQEEFTKIVQKINEAHEYFKKMYS